MKSAPICAQIFEIAEGSSVRISQARPISPETPLTIYGVSFGPTNPALQPGQASATVASTVSASTITIGTTTLEATDIIYVGASPGTAGLYQVNIRVPAKLPDGDYPLIMKLGNFGTPPGAFLTVKN